ncbi:MAG TPA: sialate O-acetylesterase [Kiritimatiellia bacterium]|nr:sialate O-acetylesterase [Kiritimatiellia bacterium]HMO99695.1 sialate O-acetylesterase [Kiritimatiellia bacterium]HMP96131.1 sialate O-acetylesterase [Kiritimatiellia bacterium]
MNIRILLAFLVSAMTALHAPAALFAYDGFSDQVYTPGSLAGQNPTISGFAGAWTPGNNIAAGGTTYALTWPGLASDDSGGAYSTATGNRSGRDIVPPLGPPAGGGANTFYISILMENSLVATSYRALELWNFGNRNLQIGANSDIDGTGQRWGMRALDNAALRATSTVAAVANETVLAVLKITCSSATNSDSVRLWINPGDLADEGASTNFVELTGLNFAGNSTNNFNYFRFAAFSGTSVGRWDELRIGTTWASVLPAPMIPTYTVSYSSNGATGGTPPVDDSLYETSDSATVLGNTNNLVRTNHDFDGWNSAADGSGNAYNPGDALLIGSADVTLYAQWTKIPPGPGYYEVIYLPNGATGGAAPEDLNYYEPGDPVTVAGSGTLVRPGFVFDGWNTESNGMDSAFDSGDILIMGAADVHLHAQWLANPSTGQPVRVFILAGQSNMRGSGTVRQAPEAWRPLTGVLFDETTPGDPASFSSEWEEIGTAVDHMGPEMAFAAILRDAYPDNRIAIVKVSQSGTGLGYWRNPGQSGHDTLMARIDVVRDRLDTALAENGIPAWSFDGFLWMQGENEANSIESVALSYQADFNDMATKVRAATGVTNLPVALGRISSQLDPGLGGPVQQPQLDYVRAGQVAWATNDSAGAWVDTDDLTLIDNWHFGSIGQLALGQRFAEAWFRIAEDRPLLTLRRAAGQPEKSHAAAISYHATFREAVTGFDASDVVILGDTGASNIDVQEMAPNDGTTFLIAISGMAHPGLVDLRIPNAAAESVGARASLPGLAEGTTVLYAPHPDVANLLFHEPFTGPDRPMNRLQSSFGGTTGGWEIQNNVTNGYRTATASSLDYGNVLRSPAHGVGGDTFNNSARALDLEKTFAGYMTGRGAGAIDVPGTTLWFSYLIRPGDAGQRQRVALLRGTGTAYSDANNAVHLMQSNGTWRMILLTNHVVDTGVPVVTGTTYLVVMRLHIGGAADPSSAHVWINPDPVWLGGAPDLASALATHTVTSADFKFGRIYWYPGSATGHGRIDELRIGTTFASVTPVAMAGEPDTDGDGLPDAWETTYFGGPTNAVASALAANGINTVLETFIAGISPVDAQARFELGGRLAPDQRILLEWQAVSGRVYGVYATTNLAQEFLPLATGLAWPQQAFTDLLHQVSAQMYYYLDVALE